MDRRPAVDSLRPATVDDVDTIAALWYHAWRDGHVGHVPDGLLPHRTLREFRRRVPSRVDHTTVAVSDARVVGFVTVADDEIEQLFVSAEARGRGVAAALLHHGEQAIAATHSCAWLAVVPGNTLARVFYERHGWTDEGPYDDAAEVAGGAFVIPCRPHEKAVTTSTPPVPTGRIQPLGS